MVNGVVGLDRAAEPRSLDDPMRRRLYAYVAEQAGPVTRDRAAASMGSAGRWRPITSTSWPMPGC